MNISSDGNINLKNKNNDDKYSKTSKNNNEKEYILITNNYIEKWNNYIINIKELINKSINEKGKYDEKIDAIIKKLENLFKNYINDIKNSYNSQYENILKAYEQKIRNLYENIFNLELNKKILEESNKNLLRKEKDFELMKEKTGIIVMNGKIINNSRKENEIFILRKENSILKDIIEKQKQENLQKVKKDSREKSKLNKRLISKMNNLSLKNKNNTKNLYDSISPIANIKNNKKIFRSHPRSKYKFKSDFISNLNKKLKASYKSLLNYPTSKSCQNDIIKNIFNSNKKSKKFSKYQNNYLNIRLQNANNKIRKFSPNNIIKKKLIPKITEKNFKSLNKTKIYQQYLPRNYKKRYRSSNPSTLGISINNTHRDISKEHNSYSKRKNNSECLNDKKINLLNSSIIKSIKTQTNKSKKGINDLSPTYGNLVNLIPKMKNLLNLRLNKSKYSNSFTMKNNRKNLKIINIKENQNKLKNNYNIKRIVFSKKDNSKIRNLNMVNNKRNKNIPDSKLNIKKLKNSINSSKGKINNSINEINTIKNSKMNLIKSNS